MCLFFYKFQKVYFKSFIGFVIYVSTVLNKIYKKRLYIFSKFSRAGFIFIQLFPFIRQSVRISFKNCVLIIFLFMLVPSRKYWASKLNFNRDFNVLLSPEKHHLWVITYNYKSTSFAYKFKIKYILSCINKSKTRYTIFKKLNTMSFYYD